MSLELSILSAVLCALIIWIIQTNRSDMRERFENMQRFMDRQKDDIQKNIHSVRDMAQSCLTEIAVLKALEDERRKQQERPHHE